MHQAQLAAQAAAHRQWVEHFSQSQASTRAEIDRHYTAHQGGVGQALKAELDAVRRYPPRDGSERWDLHLITRERVVIEQIIAAKTAELQRTTQQAQAFDGQDPLQRSPQDYAAQLAQQHSHQSFEQLHQAWEAAYIAAHEAQLLSEAIRQLTERSDALVARHAEKKELWKAREAEWERQRQYAEQREARVRFKQLADENLRLKRLREANSLTMPMAATGGVSILTWSGVRVAEPIVGAIERVIFDSAKEAMRIAAIRAGQTLGVFVAAITYSDDMANSELCRTGLVAGQRPGGWSTDPGAVGKYAARARVRFVWRLRAGAVAGYCRRSGPRRDIWRGQPAAYCQRSGTLCAEKHLGWRAPRIRGSLSAECCARHRALRP